MPKIADASVHSDQIRLCFHEQSMCFGTLYSKREDYDQSAPMHRLICAVTVKTG